MTGRFVLLLAFLGVLWAPAAHAEAAPYRYCRIDSGGISVVRTTMPDGAFVYQAAWGGGIVPGERRRFDGYIGWHGARSAPPELQLIQANGWYNDELTMPAGSRAVLDGGAGTTSFAVDADPKQDLIIYRFDLTSVLDRFGAERRLRLRIYAKDRTIPRVTLTIDLDAARRALAASVAAEATMPDTPCTTMSTELPEPVDPGQFDDCTMTAGTATANFNPWTANYTARIELAPGVGLAAAGGNYASRTPDFSLEWFRQALRTPFYGASPATLQVTIVGKDIDPKGKTFALVGSSGRIAVTGLPSVPDWNAVLALDAAGPLKLDIADDAGKLVRSIAVPPGALASIGRSLAQLADRTGMWLTKPMLCCKPEEPIIVT